MVELLEVSKGYMGQTRVLENVTFTLNRGEFLYVVGGSGAGKSSLLRMLATEETPNRGEIRLFGYSFNQMSPATLRNVRQTLGYVPQNNSLIPDLTVYDNVELSVKLAGRRFAAKQAKSRTHELLDRLGLIEKRNKLAAELSGGEAQRVAVARAMVRMPELIIADEPTGSQDKEYTWLLMDLFLKANQTGSTVVIATHDREIVKRVRKKCAILKGGRVLMEESACFY